MGSLEKLTDNFFCVKTIDEKKQELTSIEKLTLQNYSKYRQDIRYYFEKNGLYEFLEPRSGSKNGNHFYDGLLCDLILHTVSDDFKSVYLKTFKCNRVSILWLEIERCCRYPTIKPALIKLQSLRRKDFKSAKEYCERFSYILDEIPAELADRNIHNIMMIFHEKANKSIIDICFRRLVEKNLNLISPYLMQKNNSNKSQSNQPLSKSFSKNQNMNAQQVKRSPPNHISSSSSKQSNALNLNENTPKNSDKLFLEIKPTSSKSLEGMFNDLRTFSLVCNYCKKTGHYKRDCPKLQKKTNRSLRINHYE